MAGAPSGGDFMTEIRTVRSFRMGDAPPPGFRSRASAQNLELQIPPSMRSRQATTTSTADATPTMAALDAGGRQLSDGFVMPIPEPVEASREELVADLKTTRDALSKAEEENRKLSEEVKKVKHDRDDFGSKLQTKIAQFTKLQRESKDIEAERDSLKFEIDILLDEIDVLKENARIQDQNVETLKKLGERLQEDIARYKKRQEDIVGEHRLATLRLEAEIAKDVEELTKEFEVKESALRASIHQSDQMRRQADQEWLNREARLERSAKEEVKAKNDEIRKLRTKIEQLLREQIDTMRDRVKEKRDPAAEVPAARKKGEKRPAADLTVQTANVMAEMAAGKRILTFEILSKGDDFRAPVFWDRNAPRHVGDISSMDVGVKLSVDSAILHPVPASKYNNTPQIQQNEQQWYFGTTNGAVVAVIMRIFTPHSMASRASAVVGRGV